MSPRTKFFVIGSAFAVIAILFLIELVGLWDALQGERYSDSLDFQRQTIADIETENHIQSKCLDNPDFLFCNPK